jgi:RHS repeat-associated protein
MDAQTGLDYLNARYYDGSRGQFLSEDRAFLAVGNPNHLKVIANQDQQSFLTNPQQLNTYGYGSGNPMINKDPTGNNSYLIAFTAGAVYGMAQQMEYNNASGKVSSVPEYMKSEFKGGFQAVSLAAG